MKKILLSLFVIAAFIAYSFHEQGEGSEVKLNAPTLTPQTPPPPSSNSKSFQPNVVYKDGTYIGKVADAFYGPLQVRAIITGGKITDVQFLQFPNDRQTSIEISSESTPILKQEAIAAQSAQVEIVSGATQTSEAFRETMQSALDQAKG